MSWRDLPLGTCVLWSRSIWDSAPLEYRPPIVAYICHYGLTVCLSENYNDVLYKEMVGDKCLPDKEDRITPLEIKEDITEWL